MTALTWDETGGRFYETGIDRGVLFIPNSVGVYDDGVAWNGLTSISEKPSGAEGNAQFADNLKYLNLFSAEEFGATIEAFTYPDEFAQFDGLSVPSAGVSIGQQSRKSFGLCYRTLFGNDVDGTDYGYKLHLLYGCSASPSEKAYNTVNDSPEAIAFSWEISTTPVAVTSLKPTSLITIESAKVGSSNLAALELILYGTTGVDPALPLPDAVVTLMGGAVTNAIPVQPSFNSTTHVITIPTVTGLTYYIDDVAVSGTVTITVDTIVVARPNAGYIIPSGYDDDWFFDFV